MSDEPIPLWKRNFVRGIESRQQKQNALAGLQGSVDKLGAEALWLRLANGNKEDFRCYMGLVAKHLIGDRVQMDATLTVKIVKQVGERTIEIDGGPAANFKLPPRDVATGERLPQALPDRIPAVDPTDA